MPNDFITRLGVQVDTSQSDIQNQINKKIKDARVKAAIDIHVNNEEIKKQANLIKSLIKNDFNIEIDSKTANQAILQIQKQKDSFNKTNLNGIDFEITKREKQSKLFSKAIQSQMQETQKQIAIKKQLYLDEEHAYRLNEKYTNDGISKKKQLYISEEQAYKQNEQYKSKEIAKQKELYLEIEKAYKLNEKYNQNSVNLDLNKTNLTNNIDSFLKNNSKLSNELVTSLTNVKNRISDADSVQLGNLKKEFRNITSEAKALGQTGDSIFSKIKKNSLNFLNFLGSATIVMSGINLFRNMVTEVKNLDKAMISLRKVTDETEASYRNFLSTSALVARNLGTTISDLVEMTATWAKLGYTINEASKLAQVSTIYANVGEINNTETAVSDLVTAMKAYGITANDAMSIADKFNEIGNKYATDAASLGTGLKNAASSLALAGNDIDHSLAMLTAMTEIIQDSGEAGNALKILSMRLRGMKGALEELGEESEGIESISKIQTQILNLTSGKVNIFDDLDPTKFKSTYDIILGISKVWKDISEVKQAELLEIIAGKQRGNSIAALLTNMSQAEKVLKTSMQSSGSALREQEQYMKGIEYSTDRLKASFQELSSKSLDSSAIKFFIDLLNGVVNVATSVGGLVPILGTVGAIFVGWKTGILPTLIGQIQMLILSQTGYTASTVSAALAQVGLAGAIKATTLAMKSFLLTSPVGWGILAVGAIYGVSKVYEHFNVTLEEHQEVLSTLKGKYDSITSEVKSLEEELSSVQSKMREMENNNPIEFVQDDEYQKLLNANDELSRRLLIKKELQRVAGKEAEEKAIETISLKSEDSIVNYKNYYSDISGYSTKAEKITRDDAIIERIAAYEELTTKIKELEDEQLKLAQSNKTQSKEYKNVTKEIDELNNKKDEYYSYILQTTEVLQTESESIVGATNKSEEYSGRIETVTTTVDDFIKSTNQATDSVNTFSDSVSQSSNDVGKFSLESYTKQIDGYQSSISALSEAQSKLFDAKLSSSDVIDLLQQFPELIPYVDMAAEGFGNLSLGLSELSKGKTNTLVNELTSIRETLDETDKITLDKIIAAIKTTAEESKYTSKSVLSLSDSISALSKHSDITKQIKDDIKDFGYITTQTLGSLSSTYSELDDIIADYQAGLVNEEKIFQRLNSIYENDVNNYKNSVLEKKKYDEEFYKNTISKLQDDIKERAKSYGIDLENYRSLAEAKQAIDAEFEQKRLNVQRTKLRSEQATAQASQSGSGSDNALAFKLAGQWKSAEKELESYQTAIDELNKSLTFSVNFDKYTGSSSDSSSKNKFSKAFNWIPIAAEKAAEKAKKAIDSIANHMSYISKNNKIEIAVKAKVDERSSLTAIKNSYEDLAKSVGLSSKYRNLVDNGALKVETITDEKLANKIDEYQKWRNAAKEVSEQIDGINDEIAELRSQKLDNIKSFFDNKNSLINSKISTRESRISLKESEGKTASTSDYNYLISLQKSLISNTEKEYSAYKTLFDKQVMDGIIKKGSTEYYEGLSYLNDLTISAQEAQTAIQDLSNEKIKLSFVKFDKKMEKSSKVISEIDQALDFVDTDSIEQLTLLQTGYAKATQNVQSLNAEIVKLNKQYKNNKNDVVYKERLADLESQLSSNASAIKSYEDSIISVMKSRYDKQLDLQKKTLDEELKNIEKAKKKRLEALNAELDKFKEIIEARKKALRDEQETDNYNEEVAEYTKDISKLEARIATLKQAELDGDTVARRERIEAEQELADKQKELAKLQKDRSVDLAEDALDEEYDAYEKMKNKQISDAESFYDLQSEQAQSIYDAKVSQLEKLYENERQLIIEAAQLTQDEFSKAFEAINSTLKQYGLSVSTDLLASSSSGNSYASSTSSKGSAVANILGTQSESNKYNQDISNLSDLNKYIASKGYKVVTKKQVVELAKALGLSDINSTDLVGNDKVGLANKERVRKALQGMIGFSDGGMVSEINKAILRNGDEALTSVKRKEIILTPSDSENFKNFVPVMNNFMNQLKPTAISNIQPIQNKNVPIVNINLPANTTISKDAIPDYRKFLNDAKKEIVNDIMAGVSKR